MDIFSSYKLAWWYLTKYRTEARFQSMFLSEDGSSFKYKTGGVCFYYKYSLPLKVIDASYLRECIKSDVEIGDKTCKTTSISIDFLAKQKINLKI